MFGSLFNAIFAEVDRQLTEQEADTTKSVLKENFNTVIECSSQFYPPFIGSLQVSIALICYSSIIVFVK